MPFRLSWPSSRTVLLTVGGMAVGFLTLFLGWKGCAQDLGWPAVYQTIHSNFPGVAEITTGALAEKIDVPPTAPGKRPLLLDVRQPEEFAVSHLAGARRVDPDAQPADSSATDSTLSAALAGVPKDASIVTYCSVGYRSAAMAERLEAAGYTNVTNLRGSIFRWANEGRPVYRSDGARLRPVRAVHPYDRVWGQLLDSDLRTRTP